MANTFRIGQPVIVTPPPGEGAPYAAKFAQYGNGTQVLVRGPSGLVAVPWESVTARTLGLGDAVAARHGV